MILILNGGGNWPEFGSISYMMKPIKEMPIKNESRHYC